MKVYQHFITPYLLFLFLPSFLSCLQLYLKLYSSETWWTWRNFFFHSLLFISNLRWSCHSQTISIMVLHQGMMMMKGGSSPFDWSFDVFFSLHLINELDSWLLTKSHLDWLVNIKYLPLLRLTWNWVESGEEMKWSEFWETKKKKLFKYSKQQ